MVLVMWRDVSMALGLDSRTDPKFPWYPCHNEAQHTLTRSQLRRRLSDPTRSVHHRNKSWLWVQSSFQGWLDDCRVCRYAGWCAILGSEVRLYAHERRIWANVQNSADV